VTDRSICLWSPKLLPGVGACFNSVGTGERLSCTWTVRRKDTSDVRGLTWEAYMSY
jgi:hypothetical protein